MSFYAMDTDTNEIMTIYTGEELAKAVENSVNWYRSHAKVLEKQNQKLMEDAVAAVEEQLKQKISNLETRLRRCLVELNSDKEVEMYKAFSTQHARCRLTHKDGPRPYVKQKGTGVGIISIAVCPICGKEKDITDTEVW